WPPPRKGGRVEPWALAQGTEGDRAVSVAPPGLEDRGIAAPVPFPGRQPRAMPTRPSGACRRASESGGRWTCTLARMGTQTSASSKYYKRRKRVAQEADPGRGVTSLSFPGGILDSSPVLRLRLPSRSCDRRSRFPYWRLGVNRTEGKKDDCPT